MPIESTIKIKDDSIIIAFSDRNHIFEYDKLAWMMVQFAKSKGITIQTTSGRTVHLFDPKVEEIELEDIARALSQINRFTGHTKRLYSVAEHSIYVAELLRQWGEPTYVQLQGLLHDSQEAYLGDISGPLKSTPVFGDIYRLAEDNMLRCIYTALQVKEWPTQREQEAIKRADKAMLDIEIKVIRDPLSLQQLQDWQCQPHDFDTNVGAKMVNDMMFADDTDWHGSFVETFIELKNQVNGEK